MATPRGNSVPNPTKAPAIKSTVQKKAKATKTPAAVQKINQGKLR